MKPFGIRLAAGAITILLGALAAAQAQKDRQKDPDSAWTVADAAVLNTPPAPIAALGDVDWGTGLEDAPGAQEPIPQRGAPQKFPGGPADSIQLVQHTDPSNDPAESPSFPSPSPAFGMPLMGDSPALPGFPAPSPDTSATGFADFDPSQLPGAMTAPPADSDAPSPGFNSDPADSATESPMASGWGMPLAASETPPAMNESPPAMKMGAATLSLPTPGSEPQYAEPQAMEQPAQDMPELQLASPPGFDSESFSAETTTQNQSLPYELGSAPASSGSANLLRSEPAPMLAAPPALPAATLESPPALTSSPPFPNAAPASARIASMPSSAPVAPFAAAAGSTSQAINPSQTINSPGDRRLEGIQSPSVVIHKRAPSEVKVGKEATFVIHVQNVGAAEALDVQVHDRVPAGMRLVDASPAPAMQGDVMLWQLGAIPVGDERTITMLLVPEEEGELGSVARVTFEAAASVRTISTRPQLKIVQNAPKEVRIGQQLEIELEVSNPGTGDAVGVILQADVPEGLEHPKGRQLDNLLGTLRAGEVRRQILRLRAVAPGVIQNVVRLTSEDGLTAEHVTEVEVVAPALQLELTGPSRKFLERQATYQLDIANVGTDDATNVEITAFLDRGFTFVGTANEGHYDPTQHAVRWSLEQFPEGKRGQVPLTVLPVQEGEHTIRLEARGDLGLVASSERNVTVEALAELSFQITDAADPIEVGSETTYEIRLMNRGSRSDNNVQVKLQLPAGLEIVSAEQDAGLDDRGMVVFAPQAKLDAGQDVVYRVRVRGVVPGTHLTRAIVVSDQSSVPVTKEESTMVYADQ